MPIFYSVFHGRGRSILADTLDAKDPFGLDPRAIVERVTALGMAPVVDRPNPEPWHAPGTTHRIKDQGNTYLVTIGRDAEQILVQEELADGDGYEGE